MPVKRKTEEKTNGKNKCYSAVSFMDWKAGLISEKEYEVEKDKTIEVKVEDSRSRDDAR